MADNNDSKRFDDGVVSSWLMAPTSISMALVLLSQYFNHTTYATNYRLVLGTTIAMCLFALSHFIPQLKFSKWHKTYLVIYHLALSFIVIFVAPILSHFLVLFILLTFLSGFYFHLRGFLVSLAAFLLTVLAGGLYQGNALSSNIFSHDAVASLLVVVAVMLVLYAVLEKVINARSDLSQKIVRAEYEHERLVSLINNMAEAVIAIDQTSAITIYNSGALSVLNTHTQLNGVNIKDVLQLIDKSGESIDVMQLIEQARDFISRNDVFAKISEHDKIALELNISRTTIASPFAKQTGYLILLRDVTEQKSLDEERDEFISVVSHELRTPISIAEADISMAAHIVRQPGISLDKIEERLNKAHEQILFLSDMMNDLSTLSRAERADAQMEIESFAIHDLLKELVTDYEPQAKAKQLTFDLQMSEGLPEVTTSRLYLKEILQNLITNSIKYTNTGGITIDALLGDRNELVIRVIDTGIGIAKNEQEKVFDKFWRSEDPLTRQTNGTGLGMYITNKLTHRINARIEVESELGKGSIFSLFLPKVAIDQRVDQPSLVKKEVENFYN